MRERIGDYIIDQSFEPRTGSFGSTYRGKHPLFKGKVFAIKVIDNIDGRKKFDFISEIEAMLALQFQSEHIVLFSYAGETPEGDLYCSMEYCEGGDLNELCVEQKGLPPEYVALIGRQACLGLAEAHEQGIVHRDIKPSNMMLGRLRNGELGVKLIDFGLAKTLDDTMQSAPGMKGTPLFASPEQIRNEELDNRSDLYSLGVAMWYLLQGKKPKPLDLDNRHDVEAEHVNYDRPFKVTECDDELSAILEKMMAKKRDERYSSASEVLAALDQYLKQKANFPQKSLSCSDLVNDTEGSSKARSSGPLLDENRSIASKRQDRFDDVFTDLRGSPLDCSWSKFMVARKKSDGNSSLIAILNTSLFADGNTDTFDEIKQLVDSHVNLQASGAGYPDSFLRPQSFYWFSEGEAVIEFEHQEGILMRDVMRRHGSFQLSHALPLLSTLANLLDYAAEAGVPVPTVGEAEILLVPSGNQNSNDFLNQPIPKWPKHHIEVNPLSLPASISFNEDEVDVEQTLDSNDAIISSVGKDFPASVVFCARLYRLIGGKPVPSVAYQSRYGYSSISGLTEESNNLLCDHICGSADKDARCSDILRHICDAEGENFLFSDLSFSVTEKKHSGSGSKSGSASIPPEIPDTQTGKDLQHTQTSGGFRSGATPPSLPKTDIEESISVTAGPQYQSYNLPEAISTGPGEFRNPITKKRFSLPGPEIRPYKQFICQETGDMFQLSAQIEALECLADVKEPGIIHSPYIAAGQDSRINFLEKEGVELWQEGERGTCPVSGLQYKLPPNLPLLKAIIYEEEPGKVSSPFFPNEEDCQAISPDSWVGGSILSTRGREYVLPEKLPEPKLIKTVDEYRGMVTSPFVDAEFKVADNDWVKGKVLSCQITDLLCRLPEDLPERKHVARIQGDGSEGIVINPFTKREQKIPGSEWKSNQKIQDDEGREFLLPSVIPELKVSKYLLEKPGWIVDPYSGSKVDLLPDEWELGLSVEREGRSFLLLDKLPKLKDAEIKKGDFDEVGSPYTQATVSVEKATWKRGAILKCPESKCLFKLPAELPKYPVTVKDVSEQSGFSGVVRSPYATGKEVEVSGEKWISGELIQCPHSGEYFRLPENLPPLVGEVLEENGELKAFSPYADHEEQGVAASDWLPGREITCKTTGRIFRLPLNYDSLPRMAAEVADGPGVIRIPQTGKTFPVEPELWEPGAVIKVGAESEDEIELKMPSDIDPIAEASLVDVEKFGEVVSPYSGEVIKVSDQRDWTAGKVIRESGNNLLVRLPDELPEWTLTAKVDLERTAEKGYVFSPYVENGESIEISGSDWKEGNKVLCGKSKRNFLLPELPPLQAAIIDGGKGIVSCPYSTAKKRDQVINPADWVPGNVIESKKVKGREFILPGELPPLLAEIRKDRPGFLVSPFDPDKKEFEVEGGDWSPDHSVKCPVTGKEIVTPGADILPVAKTGILVADHDIEGAFLTGRIESPYTEGKQQKVEVNDWRAGKLIRCESSGLLMQLPGVDEGFPVWADEATLIEGEPGFVIDPDTGGRVKIDGTQWERRAVVSLGGESDRTVQLPRDLPPLVAEVTGSGRIRTPYESSTKEYDVALEDWQENKVIECPATQRPLQLPANLPLPEALLDREIVGLVKSPFTPEAAVWVPLEEWKPGHELKDEKGNRFQLPPKLPQLPEAKELNLEEVEVVPPFPGSKPMKPPVWQGGEALTCSETGGHFVLPANLALPVGGLTVDAREALGGSQGVIVDPFTGKELEVPGEQWVPGGKITSEGGNQFQLPDALPLLSAELDIERPGFVKSPYVNAKAFRLASISDWVEGASVKCPKTEKTMMLPKGLPFSQEEVLASWEKSAKARKSLLVKVGGGLAVLLILLLIFIFRPDPEAKWEAWKNETMAVTGLQRLELAADGMKKFPDREPEIRELANPLLDKFDTYLDSVSGTADRAGINSLEKSLQAFGNQNAAATARQSIEIARTALDLEESAGYLELEQIAAERSKIESTVLPSLPGFADRGLAALAKREKDLKAAMVSSKPKEVKSKAKGGVEEKDSGKSKGIVKNEPVKSKEKEKEAEPEPKETPKTDPPADKMVGEEKKVDSNRFASGANIHGVSGLQFVWIEPGSFKMGTEKDELEEIYLAWSNASTKTTRALRESDYEEEAPQMVELTDGFWLAETETTVAQYLEFLNDADPSPDGLFEAPSEFSHFALEKEGGEWVYMDVQGAKWGSLNNPVVEVTWLGAIRFAEWLNEKHKDQIPEGYEFSLPSEAQWEYAARAGSDTPLPHSPITFKKYNFSPEVGEIAWYAGNSKREDENEKAGPEKEDNFDYIGTQPVKGRKANKWGLYDMLGNVREWCYDVSDSSISRSDDVKKNPVNGGSLDSEDGTDDSVYRVIRGGAYWDHPARCRVAKTGKWRQTQPNHSIGFRVALVPKR